MEEHEMEAATIAASVNHLDDNGRCSPQASPPLHHQSSSSSSSANPPGQYTFFSPFSAVHACIHAPDHASSFLLSHAHPFPPYLAPDHASSLLQSHVRPFPPYLSVGAYLASSEVSVEAESSISSLHLHVAAAKLTKNHASVVLSRQGFLSGYLSTLLPELRKIYSESASGAAGLNERHLAVKLAADMSLVLSAGSNSAWSQALLKELMISSTCRLISCSSEVERRGPKLIRKSIPKRKMSSACGFLHLLKKRTRSRSGGLPRNYIARNKFSRFSRLEPTVSHLSSVSNPLSGCADGHSDLVIAPRPRLACLEHPFNRSSRTRICGRGLSSYLRVLRATRSRKRPQGSAMRHAASTMQQQQFLHNHYHQQSAPFTKEQIEILGGLVPGGGAMDVPLLLEEAADYIVTMQMQIEALESLSQSLGTS